VADYNVLHVHPRSGILQEEAQEAARIPNRSHQVPVQQGMTVQNWGTKVAARSSPVRRKGHIPYDGEVGAVRRRRGTTKAGEAQEEERRTVRGWDHLGRRAALLSRTVWMIALSRCNTTLFGHRRYCDTRLSAYVHGSPQGIPKQPQQDLTWAPPSSVLLLHQGVTGPARRPGSAERNLE